MLTVDAFDAGGLYELEVDHSMEGTLDEFSVYADANNPWGNSAKEFAQAGVKVTYDSEEQKWIIDFGRMVTDFFVENGGITFYLVLADEAGNQWGSMYDVTDENTFAYTITQDEAPKKVINLTQNKSYDTIQAAINATTVGDNIIKVYPGNYGTESIDIVQKEGVNITLEAAGEVVLKNQIRFDGGGRFSGSESLTIKGFTFDFSDAILDDIITTAKIEAPNYVYSHNIFIEDCIFIGKSEKPVVAVRAAAQGGHRNFQIIGCRGENLHSLAQLTNVNDVTVKNCSVSGGESGINLQNSTDITITNLTVDGTNYGVRAGQGSGTNKSTMTISNSKLKAKYPIWLREGTPKTVVVINSELAVIEGGQDIRNDAGDEVTILIDPPVYNEDLETYYMTLQEAIAAWENAKDGDYTITIKDGTYNEDSIIINQQVGKSLTIKAENNFGAIFVNDNRGDSTGIFHIC